MRRCRTRARARILWSVLAVFMASLCSAQVVDVVVNLATADGVDADQVLALRKVVDVSSMDNSDLFVAMCLPGTFSPDTEGICHDCVKCQANQYEKLECIPTRDRTCANCTVCGSNDIELCQCAVKTSQCVTGDRVCLKVPPTVVNLVVDFSSNGVLSNKQQTFVRSGLAVGYTDWLAMQFDVDPETVELTDFVRTGTLTYKAYFRFNEVYGQAKIARIQGQNKDFFQGGIYYTFGGGARRRRLLQQQNGNGVGTNYLSTEGVSSDCLVDKNCTEPFTEFKFNENSTCTGMCWPVPCPPGYSGSAKKCELCQPGTFKADAAFADCATCPAGYTSPTGANSSDACVALETSPVLLLLPTTTAEISYQNQTTTSQGSSETSPGVPLSSQPPTSPRPSSSPSAGTTPSPASSSSPPATQAPSTAPPAPQQGSSAQSSAVTQTTPAPPAPPPPPPPPPAPPGSPSSAGTGGSYSSNVNTNNNTLNVQPAQVSVSVQPPAVNVYFQQPPAQSPSPPSAQPVFNNNIRLEIPKQRMPDAYYYHRHGYYDRDDDDWASYLILIGFAITVFGFSLCAFMGGCPCSYPQGYYEVDRDRPVIRYRLIREDQGSRLVRDGV